MSNDWFFEKFALIADAPGAVERMRGLVLELAVRGHLLTSTSRWEKHLLKTRTTKIGSGATPAGGRESYSTEGTPLIRSMNIHFRGFQETGLVFLSDEQADKLSNVAVQPNDVLLNITGASIGRVTIAPDRMDGARVNQHVTIIRTKPDLSPRFLAMFLASPIVQRMINEIQTGATRQALTKGMIEQFEILLPPLAEQKRIVAKVDELMGLCDALEAQQQERESRKSVLVRSSLSRFAEAPTSENLGYLFHKSYDIPPSELRKSILTLAIQGKLVPQDPNDEPAEKGVAAARREKGLPMATVPSEQLSDELFEAPTSWCWVKVNDVAENRLGKMLDEEKNSGTPQPYLRNTNVHWFHFDLKSIKTILIQPQEVDEFRLARGDVMICEGGHGIARTAVWENQIPGVVFQKALHRVRPFECLNPYFFAFCIRMYEVQGILAKYYTGAGIPHFTGRSLAKLVFPLPPLAEQHRIVAKVDQLMALVDELERQQEASRENASNLLDAIVHEMTSGG